MSRFVKLEFDDEAQDPGQREAPLSDEERFLSEADKAMGSGDFERALKFFAKTLEGAPSSHEAWIGQARALIEQEDLERARQWIDKAIEKLGEEPDLLAAKAIVLSRLGDHEAAMAFSDAAIENGPDRAYPWIARGDALLALDEKQADYCFGKGLQCEPDLWFWQWLVARIYAYYGKFSLAMKHAQEALALDASHCAVWLQAGCCQRALGLADLAASSFERARELNPTCDEARAALSELSRTGVGGRLRNWSRRLFSR
jgi:tetratricopeptide (TPR) repeat protein